MDDYKPRMGKYGLPEEANESHADAYKREHAADISEKKERKPVVTKKKSRLRDSFIVMDLKSVAVDIFWEDVIPTIRSTIVDTLKHSIEMIFYGEKGKDVKDRKVVKTSYSSYYDSPVRRRVVSSARRRPDLDMITYDTRKEAEDVRSLIFQHLDDYQIMTVANVYELSGIDPKEIPYTAEKLGWISDTINKIDISRVRDGYVLELPRPKELD